jgi:siderophore synthetase component
MILICDNIVMNFWKGLTMNAMTPLRYFSQQDPEMTQVWRDAAVCQHRSVARTLQALLREGLLNPSQLIRDHHVSWLPLWGEQTMLRMEGLQSHGAGAWSLQGAVTLFRENQPARILRSGSELLRVVANALPLAVDQACLERLSEELENSLHNDLQCQTFRRHWGSQLRAQFRPHGETFLSALRTLQEPHSALLLEQWGCIGHPNHPTFKTKSGLSDEEVRALSPEFHPVLHIAVIAVRTSCLYVADGMGVQDYLQWFRHHYPEAALQWRLSLQKRAMQVNDWYPLPVHPYQLQRVLPEKFAAEIQRGDIVLLDDVSMAVAPTMSFRTVCALNDEAAPHIKLPVGLRLTTAQRTVSPKSVIMGPRISQLLRQILQREHGFGQTLDIAAEITGAYFLDDDDDKARHLSVIYRSNPGHTADNALMPVPVACLYADSPFAGEPLICELIRLACGDQAQAPLTYFRQYSRVVLTAALSAYLLYGIAFEAHQQNSYLRLDPQFRPVQLQVRDFGDLRVYQPVLAANGFVLNAVREGHSVFTDIQPVREKILHATMICQLAEFVLLLSRHYQLPESAFWEILRSETENLFDQLKPRCDADFWQAERQAILHAPWPVKSLLRMRLADTVDDLVGSMPNPLANTGAA